MGKNLERTVYGSTAQPTTAPRVSASSRCAH